jgi:phosphatidate cytidylyltransferase
VTEGKAAPVASAEATRNLVIRIVVALVLAPLALAIAYAGGWLWIALVALAAAGVHLEWLKVVGALPVNAAATGAIALRFAGFCLASGQTAAAVLVLALGLAAVAWLAPLQRRWAVGGFCYSAAAELASVLIRRDQVWGFVALLLVLLVVWGTDIGGYFAGRGIGGPKLWPRVSPRKTWAGAIGGLVASLAVVAGFAAFGLGRIGPLLLLGSLLSIVSQLGDLFESAVKRRFGVKDSSHIIPGHGGLLDRLDGFIAAAILAAVVGLLRGGVDGVGRGLMVW